MPVDWRFGAPWNWNLGKVSKKKPLPVGFVGLYGEKPSWKSYHVGRGKFKISYPDYKVLVVQWETKLKHYKGMDVEINDEDTAQLGVALEIYSSWEMGDVTFYNSTYGPKGRFLDSKLPDYSFSLYNILDFPQFVVSQYHIEQILREMPIPKPLHFFVPPGIGGVINKEEDE